MLSSVYPAHNTMQYIAIIIKIYKLYNRSGDYFCGDYFKQKTQPPFPAILWSPLIEHNKLPSDELLSNDREELAFNHENLPP